MGKMHLWLAAVPLPPGISRADGAGCGWRFRRFAAHGQIPRRAKITHRAGRPRPAG